jgi:hypothetical protein
MEYLIGLILALAVAGAATIIGFDRERAFYPTVLIVIASYYVLFAVMDAPGRILMIEFIVALGFVLAAVIGFKTNLWLVVIALVAHGVFDIVHARFIQNPGVPDWWSEFCLTFDVVVGVYLAVLLMTRSNFSLHQGAPSPHVG